MTYVFQEAVSFTTTSLKRGFPLAAALKDFWLCFAPRYRPFLASCYKGEVDPYARAPTQHLFQEDRTVDVTGGIRFTHVSTSCIPSIAEFVSSFPFIKNLHLTLESQFDSSLAPLSQMRLLTHLCLIGPTPEHLSEIVNVSVKNLYLSHLQGNELSSLFPHQEAKSRLQRTLRRLTLIFFSGLTDISALAGFETLLELNLCYCDHLSDLSSISQLKELRALSVTYCRNLEMNSFVNAVTRLEFLLELEISFCDHILDEHVRKIATIETLEKLKVNGVRGSSESLSMLLDPQNLPNLREFELTDSASSPFESSVDSRTCFTLEKLHLRFHVRLDSTDISIIPKKFPNLTSLNLLDSNLEDGTDFAPLGDLICLSELILKLELGFDYEFASAQNVSLESAIPKLINLKKLEVVGLSQVEVKKMLVPLRKLEVLAFQSENEASGTNAILNLVEEGHLPVLSTIAFSRSDRSVPELLEDCRKQGMEEEQKPKHGQEELQAARRVREGEK